MVMHQGPGSVRVAMTSGSDRAGRAGVSELLKTRDMYYL